MVTTVTSTTVAASAAMGVELVALAILTLVALLVQKEIVSGLPSARALRLARALNASIIPLVFVFAVAIFFKALDFLR